MWVLKRKEDGKYVAKTFTGSSYTRSLVLAEKFPTKENAIENSCIENEVPIQINPYEYFK